MKSRCEECGGTGKRVTTYLDAGDGTTARVTGSAPLDAQSEAALLEIVKAAEQRMKRPRNPNRNQLD